MLTSTSTEDLYARRRVKKGCVYSASVSGHNQGTNAHAESAIQATSLYRSMPNIQEKVLQIAGAKLKSP